MNQFVTTYFETFNQYKWKELSNMYAENAEFKDPSLGIGIVKQSHQQFIEKYSNLQSQISELHDSIVKTYTLGDKNIVIEFISSGIAPDGTKFELPICTIFEIENGLIVKDYTYYDNN